MSEVIVVGRINSSQDGIVIHPEGISHTQQGMVIVPK